MNVISRVGVDLAKQVIQVHTVDTAGKVAANRALARGKLIEWCVHLPARCLVAMEASSGAHHWCRKLVTPPFLHIRDWRQTGSPFGDVRPPRSNASSYPPVHHV